MKKVMNVLKGICVFVLAAGIIIFGLIQIASFTILSKDYILSKLEETNYYINAYTQVRDDFENYIYQSGLDKEVIDGIISIEDIKNDTNIIISNIYNGVDKQIDVTNLKENLKENIDKSLEGRNIPNTTQKSIEKFIDQIAGQYEDSISHTKFESSIYETFQKVQKYVRFASTASIVMIGISSIVVLTINNKKYWRSITNIGIPFVSSGLFYEFVDIYINSRVKIANIMVLNDAITVSIRAIVADVFATIKIIGLTFVVVGIIFILTGNIIRAKKHSEHRHSRNWKENR